MTKEEFYYWNPDEWDGRSAFCPEVGRAFTVKTDSRPEKYVARVFNGHSNFERCRLCAFCGRARCYLLECLKRYRPDELDVHFKILLPPKTSPPTSASPVPARASEPENTFQN